MISLCECGCGQVVKNRFISGHNVRVNHPMSLLEARQKNSEAQKKRYENPKEHQKLSQAHKGKKPSLETRRKLSEAGKGRKHSEETRRKIGDASRGRKHSMESRKKISDTQRGRKCSMESCQRKSTSMKKAYTPELRAKRRAAWRGDKNPMRRPEVTEKVVAANRTKVRSEELKKRISATLKIDI